MDGMYFDREGREIELLEWAMLFENMEYKIVAQDELPDGRHLSTVWLGLNHQYGDGPPLIFETMMFPECDLQMRYSTLEQAEAGHAAVLAVEAIDVKRTRLYERDTTPHD